MRTLIAVVLSVVTFQAINTATIESVVRGAADMNKGVTESAGAAG